MIQSDADLTKLHEGCTLIAKPDAKGKWALGYGHDISAPAPGAEAPTCTQEQADTYFALDLELARQRAATVFQGINIGARWSDLDPVRQAVLTDMAYEMGGAGLREFQDMLLAVYEQRWEAATREMLNSLWAQEVPGRARMDAGMMLEGTWPQV